MNNTQHTVGETKVFVEHYAIVHDLDSLSQFAGTALLKEGKSDYKRLTENAALRECDVLLCGNTGEAEYMGVTGRTVLAEFDGNYFVLKEEITPATVDINQFFSMD